jgi:hypothetical protein
MRFCGDGAISSAIGSCRGAEAVVTGFALAFDCAITRSNCSLGSACFSPALCSNSRIAASVFGPYTPSAVPS